jgi:hypothetical protein
VPRRVRLPAADELFRPTVVTDADVPAHDDGPADGPADGSGDGAGEAGRSPSGRVRHDQKMTVYVTSEELLDLEAARLTLRRAGVGVDRGRLVREAVALALADLDERGADSDLAQRLSPPPRSRGLSQA